MMIFYDIVLYDIVLQNKSDKAVSGHDNFIQCEIIYHFVT